MKIINHFALLLLFGCAVSCTQPENSISNESIGIIPLPSTYELKPGTFYITGQSSIGIDKSDPEMTALQTTSMKKSVTPQAFPCR